MLVNMSVLVELCSQMKSHPEESSSEQFKVIDSPGYMVPKFGIMCTVGCGFFPGVTKTKMNQET